MISRAVFMVVLLTVTWPALAQISASPTIPFDVPVRYQAPANGGYSDAYYYGYGYGAGWPGYYQGDARDAVYQGYRRRVGAEHALNASARASRSNNILPTYSNDWHSEKSDWRRR